MIEIAVHKTGELAAALNEGLSIGETVRIVEGSDTLAVVLAADDFDALVATQLLLCKNGGLAAVAEGLADLAAGRTDDWLTLRTDFGRAEDDQLRRPAVAVLSHRARWDLELLPPSIAEHCFAELDAVVAAEGAGAAAIGLPMGAPFRELRIATTNGYCMVLRDAIDAVAVVHIDAVS